MDVHIFPYRVTPKAYIIGFGVPDKPFFATSGTSRGCSLQAFPK